MKRGKNNLPFCLIHWVWCLMDLR